MLGIVEGTSLTRVPVSTSTTEVQLTCPVCLKKVAVGRRKPRVVSCWRCQMIMTLDGWLEWKARQMAGIEKESSRRMGRAFKEFVMTEDEEHAE